MGPVAALFASVVVAASLAVASPHVSLTAAGHTPKVGSHWPYTVHLTAAGKPVRGRVTAQIVDPLGGKHPVGFGVKKGNVTNVAFKGSFHDFVVWPKSSTSVPLTFRITVVSGKTKRVVNYKVTPRS